MLPNMLQRGSKDIISCITLDITGTVLGLKDPVGKVYCGIAEKVADGAWAVPTENEMQENFPKAYKSALKRYPCFGHSAGLSARQWWEVVVRDSFLKCGCPFPTETAFQKTFMKIYQHYGSKEGYSLYPDVVPLITMAHENSISLGVISNNTDRIVTDTLPMLGLHEHFSFSLTSHVRGYSKPSSFIFDEASKLSSQPPASILHIGDTFSADYEGAVAAGMKALYLNRSGTGPPAEHPDAYTISSLDEVAGLLFGSTVA